MFAYWVSKLFFKLTPWRCEVQEPIPKKIVAIGAPHTSNWDFLFMLMIAWSLKRKAYWIGKHTLFKPPVGFITRFLGGIPVDRSARQNTVHQILEEMKSTSEFFLVVTPEGTRKRVEFWKSGFYHIAKEAQIPIVLGFADYEKKRCGLGDSFIPNGDIDADFERIRLFYAPIHAKYPERFNSNGVRPKPSSH